MSEYVVDGVRYRAGKRVWSADDDAQLRAAYPGTATAQLACAIGRSLSATYGRANYLGLTKSAEFLASPAACRLRRGDHVGASFRFPKGHVPANKGLRRPGWSAGRMRETQFRKGNATKWSPVGTTRLIDGYCYRKVSDVRNVPWTRNWKPEHHLLWTAAHGPIPAGHAVVFTNGNRQDIRPDNLTLISRRELMRRNTVHNLPKPVAQAVQLLGALTRQIRRKQRAREKQD